MSEPRFLALAEVMALHRLQLEAFGGQDGVRDLEALAGHIGVAVPPGFGGEGHDGLAAPGQGLGHQLGAFNQEEARCLPTFAVGEGAGQLDLGVLDAREEQFFPFEPQAP